MQVREPGVLERAERATPRPGRGEVLVEVEACGVCGADLGDIDARRPDLEQPRVPGHEVVGRIVALGSEVPALWAQGQRVGIGRLGGHCGICRPCRRGQFQVCERQAFVGSSCDGGYAEIMLARASGLIAIPGELDTISAAPILCAGIATFNALRKCGAEAGDIVAIHGIGGLGHMALQYAKKMGFRVVAVGRGAEKGADATALGAHRYIDAELEDAAASLRNMGGAQAIVTTVGNGGAVTSLVAGLAPRGRIVVLAAGKEALAVGMGQLVVGERSVEGSITGSPYDTERALDFSVLADVRPWVETFPLDRAQDAVDRVRSGLARYRVVLVVAGPGVQVEGDRH